MLDPIFDTEFAAGLYDERYRHKQLDRGWNDTSRRVVTHPFKALIDVAPQREHAALYAAAERVYELHSQRKAIAGGRYLWAAGRPLHQVNNCVLLRCPDSREGWATTSYNAEMALMTGAGIGVWYGDVREAGAPIEKTGGVASGPLPKMRQVNDTGRHIMSGGNRRSAIWAGLPWWHPDIFEFIVSKDYSDEIKALKKKDWNFPAPMDTTNISVSLDDEFFYAYGHCTRDLSTVRGEHVAPDGGKWETWAHRVYDTAIDHMLKHGEPGFTVDTGDKSDEVLRNACTEITSADDSDVCNLGSLVLSRFDSPDQFGVALRDWVLFLTAGSVYSDVPYARVGEVRELNRRLGAGLMGVHEFIIRQGARYGSDEALEVLEPYMREYDRALEYAHEWQERLGLSLSKGASAIAPNGTIAIVAETTASGDPFFSAAESRQVKVGTPWGDTYRESIVVDPVARRLAAEGVDPSLIEDAHELALDPERRIRQQHFLQAYTDHAISSTVNLPHVITNPSEARGMGDLLMKYLPGMRGITMYPNGARAGQPRTPVDLEWALAQSGVIEDTSQDSCATGACSL